MHRFLFMRKTTAYARYWQHSLRFDKAHAGAGR